jgi:hypothetical protein
MPRPFAGAVSLMAVNMRSECHLGPSIPECHVYSMLQASRGKSYKFLEVEMPILNPAVPTCGSH